MELAEPDIPSGFADCVEAGATEITVFPYMLSPGKHSTRDIPRIVGQSAKSFGHVTFNVTPAFGVHEKLAELVLDRAGVEPVKAFAGSEADRCWDPDCSETLCGDACRARTARQTALPGGTT
jgi:sirohydrochlorin ferrochelatase